jgi:hypothetical protein
MRPKIVGNPLRKMHHSQVVIINHPDKMDGLEYPKLRLPSKKISKK